MTESVVIDGPAGRLCGDLGVPERPQGVVVFAHGSGSSRHSRRNRGVAKALRRSGFATLLIDLLTADEEQVDIRTRQLRFDIELLAERVGQAVEGIRERADIGSLGMGLFGASTGAAAALVTAAQDRSLRAVVSRGGRPDLAGQALVEVTAPTLLIVGGLDEEVLHLNRQAATRLSAPHHLEVVAGASHLFEESGALDEVARLAASWFQRYLPG
ncbi:dienelactone hydrolase family protein [Amycolatopsis palatopharyngis]|uniref:dienelactone hydrolase family protein n=1 Tax=Amycolatopsis palatopharyngis TaxID=187982 RepID=UPI000E22F581|nr:dienelactone hydrolase family protein [Amycolatopsis palatopharyngis]